jgi:hypothetical protein
LEQELIREIQTDGPPSVAAVPVVMVTQGPIDEREHAVGEEVLVEELKTVYLTLKKGVEAQNSGAPVSSEDRRTWGAEGVDAQVFPRREGVRVRQSGRFSHVCPATRALEGTVVLCSAIPEQLTNAHPLDCARGSQVSLRDR